MRGPPWWRGELKNAGFRLTLPRQIILNVLTTTPKHLSAEEIFLLVHKKYPGIGLATVYRTLDLLTDMNLISNYSKKLFGPHGRGVIDPPACCYPSLSLSCSTGSVYE